MRKMEKKPSTGVGRSDAGGRTKIWWAAAIDGDMKRILLQQDEEDDDFDGFSGELERGP